MENQEWDAKAQKYVESYDSDDSKRVDQTTYIIKINLKLRLAMDGATKQCANAMYPDEEAKAVLGKVRGYLYKRFHEESGINLNELRENIEQAKCQDPGTGITKMQILERLGLAGAYIDFINWETKRIKEQGVKYTGGKPNSKWAQQK